MRSPLFSIILLASALVLPLAAHADPIDNFVLTGPGLTITFSLPASPGFINEYNYFDHSIIYGFTVTTPFTATENGQTYTHTYAHFYSGDAFPGPLGGLQFYTITDSIQLLAYSPQYNDSPTDPTFLTGSFTLYPGYQGGPIPGCTADCVYKLTITPQTATAPEPPTVALLLTGTAGLLLLASRVRKTRITL